MLIQKRNDHKTLFGLHSEQYLRDHKNRNTDSNFPPKYDINIEEKRNEMYKSSKCSSTIAESQWKPDNDKSIDNISIFARNIEACAIRNT